MTDIVEDAQRLLANADKDPDAWTFWLRNFGSSLVGELAKAREENDKLRALEKAVRVLAEDEDYEAGGLDHHDSCNIYHAWGPDEVPCDCYVKDVVAALKALETE